jgi:predicted permease
MSDEPAIEPPANPPRLARWLLRRVLDGAARSAILGDLDEEFARFVVPQRGVAAARRWYWRQTIASLAACLRNPEASTFHADRGLTMTALVQDRRGWTRDVRAALRFCARRPILSVTVVLTLTIGIAANTAVFAVVNGTYFKKLPIANADRLVAIRSTEVGQFSYPEFLSLRGAAGFDALLATGSALVVADDRGASQRVIVDLVTGDFFEALGVGPTRYGRLFGSADDSPSSAPVVVLSERFWRSALGGDPAAIGRPLRLQRASFTIVGIAPGAFTGTHKGFGPDAWVPLSQAPLLRANSSSLGPQASWLSLTGIVTSPASIDAARASLAGRWRAAGIFGNPDVRLIPRGPHWYSPEPESRLEILGVFVALILLIACLNVSTLFASGVQARQKELAIRAALGAGRLRLLRQLLAEHLVLASIAGVLGGILGGWLARFLMSSLASRTSPGDVDVSWDRNVVLFTIAISLVAGLVAGVLPAFRWSRVRGLSALQGREMGALGRMFRAGGMWWLIPWQVALGTVLLASAGLLAKTVHQLRLGIESTSPEHVWFASLDLDEAAANAAMFVEVQERARLHIATLPDVDVVALSTLRPLSTISRSPIFVEGLQTIPQNRPMPWGPPPPPPPRGARLEKVWIVSDNYVSPDFFSALGLPLVRGRAFTAADSPNAPRVAVVNETLAARAFGKADPIGRRLALQRGSGFDIEVVGVVKDLRYEHLRQDAPDAIFLPIAQIPPGAAVTPAASGRTVARGVTAIVRARSGARFSAEELRRHLQAFDGRVFVDRVWTFDEEAARALSQERLLANLGSLLGLLALVLLIIGLYGTLSAAVTRGTRELGIRLALGAAPGSLRALVVGRSLLVVALGLAIGFPLSYAASRYFGTMLYGVQPVEPLVAAGILIVLAATAALAAYFPSRQAARVDPVIALRAE